LRQKRRRQDAGKRLFGLERHAKEQLPSGFPGVWVNPGSAVILQV